MSRTIAPSELNPSRRRRLAAPAIPLILAALLAGCASSPQSQLERVARDWSLTIRASQVVPVYPLTEDLQPGDVLMVAQSIKQQADTYDDKGFLPLDQHVTRLHGLDYQRFYGEHYLDGAYAATPHVRHAPRADGQGPAPLTAPRVGFPTYAFDVQAGAGLRLALPLQAVPVGLGVLRASRAVGSVTLKDAYTYGVDGETAYRALLAWHQSAGHAVGATLRGIASNADTPVFLRVVTRVYIVRSVTVGLTAGESTSAGVDAGAAPGLALPDLSGASDAEVKAAAQAYSEAATALGGALNTLSNNLPGGAIRFVGAGRRSVTIEEQFERPLVIGYAGFDVRVFRDGSLSPPIATVSVLEGDSVETDFVRIGDDGGLSACYDRWLDASPDNLDAMANWLVERKVNVNPADLYLNPLLLNVLIEAEGHFRFATDCPRR